MASAGKIGRSATPKGQIDEDDIGQEGGEQGRRVTQVAGRPHAVVLTREYVGQHPAHRMIFGNYQDATGHAGTVAMGGPLKIDVFPRNYEAGLTGDRVKRKASVGL